MATTRKTSTKKTTIKKDTSEKSQNISIDSLLKKNGIDDMSLDDLVKFAKKEKVEKTKIVLEKAAYNCPVHHTLSENVEKNISFTYLS